MIPVLFDKNETSFTSMGYGVIADCTSCLVTEELNGKFELRLSCTVSSRVLDRLKLDNIILVEPRKGAEPEPFRISKVIVAFNGVVTVEAQHISYLLNYILATPLTAEQRSVYHSEDPRFWFNQQFATRSIPAYASGQFPFTMTEGITAEEGKKMPAWDRALPIKQLMQGMEGSLLDIYGGEYYYNRFTLALLPRRGKDKKYRVVYGENMQSMTYSDDSKELYTGAVGYWKGTVDKIVSDPTPEDPSHTKIVLEEKYVQGDLCLAEGAGAYTFQHIASLDFTVDFDNPPSVAQLNTKTRSYIKSNQYGKATVNMNAKVGIPTPGSVYGSVLDKIGRDDLELGDTIHAVYTPAGIEVYTRVTSVVYDTLKEQNKEVVIGKIQKKASSLLARLL